MRPGPRNKLTVRLSTRFNEAVQFDILFYDVWVVVHLIDECIRWSVKEQVDDHQEESLIEAFTSRWFQPYGPRQVLIMDGERGLTTDAALTWLDHWGVSRIL